MREVDEKQQVLLTGAFGNVGMSTLAELVRKGYRVRCFDLETKANQKAARRFKGQIEVMWGDLRCQEDIAAAVHGQDVVIHLAFIIPKLSATGFESEEHPDWAWQINVGGTRNLLQAMKAEPDPPRLLFASSYHVYGRTQDQPPPRTILDPVSPIEHYARHKVECERMIRESGLRWAIFRLAATLPIAMKLDPGMFDIPLDNRMEYVHTRDVGLAFANAVNTPEVWGKVWLIGGGPLCQYAYGEIAQRVLEGLGVGMLPAKAFASTPFATDWIETADSEKLLHYQRHTLDDYVRDMILALGYKHYLIRAFRSVVRFMLLQQSPYYRAGQPGYFSAMLHGIKMLRRKPTHVQIG
jgi:UDP-glucose 4-epimerase